MRRTFFFGCIVVASLALVVWGFFGVPTVLSGANGGDPVGIIDPPSPALTVRVLDVGQGDATYIYNGGSRAIIDGGPDAKRFGKLLDSLHLNGSTIDVVVISHAHADHYTGLLALFDSR